MAKKTALNIVDAWNKILVPAVESGALTATEQLTFLYIVIAINRNMWEPVEINPAIIAGATGKDKRTIKTAIANLEAKQIISIDHTGAVYFGRKYIRTGEGSNATDNLSTARTVRNDNTSRADSGEGNAEAVRTSRKRREIFN